MESILRANYKTYHLFIYYIKSPINIFSYLYAEVAFKIGATFQYYIFFFKKVAEQKKKSLNKSTTKVQQVTFFSKENLTRATTFMKKVKVPHM